MASAAMPAIANFLMRTSFEKVDRRWALARPQSTYSLDRSVGLTRCNLPRCGFDQGGKPKPPAPDRVCLRRVVGGKPLPFQQSLADGRILTGVQTRRHRTHHRHRSHGRQIRHRRAATGVETRIHATGSTRSGGCRFSAACRSWTATCAPAPDDREFARTISQAGGRRGLPLDQASNSAARRICSNRRPAD